MDVRQSTASAQKMTLGWKKEEGSTFPLSCPPTNSQLLEALALPRGRGRCLWTPSPLKDFPGACLTLAKHWHQNTPPVKPQLLGFGQTQTFLWSS